MMDIYTYLKNDHDEIKDYLEALSNIGAAETERRKSLFLRLKNKVQVHSQAEEEAFYAPLKQEALTREKINHSQKEHEKVDRLLRSLASGQLSEQEWQETLKDVKAALEHHIHQEEYEVFPRAQQVINAFQAKEMMKEMQAHKEKMYESQS